MCLQSVAQRLRHFCIFQSHSCKLDYPMHITSTEAAVLLNSRRIFAYRKTHLSYVICFSSVILSIDQQSSRRKFECCQNTEYKLFKSLVNKPFFLLNERSFRQITQCTDGYVITANDRKSDKAGNNNLRQWSLCSLRQILVFP